MKFLNRPFLFFLYSNLFIAVCAVIMAWQTCTLLLHQSLSLDLAGFIFFGTLTSYSFHWMLTPADNSASSRTAWQQQFRWFHTVLLVISVGATAFFLLPLLDHWPLLLFTAVITFLYSAPKIPHPLFGILKKVALGKTLFLAIVWMHVTTLLPLLVSDQSWQPSFGWFAASRFFLIYAICILFDRRDRESDIALGIRSLITRLSEGSIRFLFFISLAFFFISTIALYFHQITPIVIAILLIPGLILVPLYRYAIHKGGDIFYYFVLDGFMALSSLLTLIPGIIDSAKS